MRRTLTKSRLRLGKETLRVLSEAAMRIARGGEQRDCISEVTAGWSCGGDCTRSGFLSCLNSSAACASAAAHPL